MDNVLFYHGMTTDKRRFTIAGEFIDDLMVLGAAVCSKKDAFVKRVGRLKAEGRICSKNNKGRILVKECKDKSIQTFLAEATKFNTITCSDFLTTFNMDNRPK